MKSLKERLAEKAKRDERKRRKKSVNRIVYLNVKIPRLEHDVEGDAIYIEARVAKIIEQIRCRSSFDVFNEFRKQFRKIERKMKAEQKARTLGSGKSWISNLLAEWGRIEPVQHQPTNPGGFHAGDYEVTP